jgi:pimeloyl-ACP methyl ester carboxylesterase
MPFVRLKILFLPATLVLILSTTGCGTFIAHRMTDAPNRYPTWFARKAPVTLAFSSDFLTNWPAQFVKVGPPSARLCYRVVEPADYHLKVSSTNWTDHGKPHFRFSFHADMPGTTNEWSAAPRGTVVLLHGYALGQFAMTPWALRLAEEGWRCVLVDLRGHGDSTGKKIYYGLKEAGDLSRLLDALSANGELRTPVAAVGESYGAALALRWKASDPRVASVVAIAPYAVLSNSVLNLCHEYAGWFPQCWLKAGLVELPSVMNVEQSALDITEVLATNRVSALFIAGTEDRITPATDVERLQRLASPGSELFVMIGATHEALPYYFEELVPPVLDWLNANSAAGPKHASAASP